MLGLEPADAVHARLVEGYLRLEPYPEVPQALRSLAGRPLAILSNGSPGMLQAVLERADLGGRFTAVLSVDAVRTYKPSPRVYELAPRHLGDGSPGVTASAWPTRTCPGPPGSWAVPRSAA